MDDALKRHRTGFAHLADLDAHLIAPIHRPNLAGLARFCVEFLYFGLKEARACLFAGLFFAAVFAVPRT